MSEALKLLTGTQKKILKEGIVGAYPNLDELKILLSEQMDVQLGAIVSDGAYETKVFELIQYFQANGRIGDFIGVVVNDKPNSPFLSPILKEFPGILGKSVNRNKRKVVDGVLWVAPILILSLIIVWFVSNPDKSAKPIIFNCEGISLKIPQNWHNDGADQKCQLIASGIGYDATITPKSFQGNEMKAPRVILIVDDIYEPEANFRDFYEKQKQDAEKLIKQTNSSLILNSDDGFKNHDVYELIYNYTDDQGNFRRRKDIGFIHEGKQYIIRYDASIQDFPKYEQEAKEILYSLDFISE